MKKLLTATLFLLLIACLSVPAFAIEGNGTESEPYLIYDKNDLETFRNIVYDEDKSACAMLMADIVLNENFDQNKFSVGQDGSMTYDGSSDIAFEQWTPIFRGSAPYNGVFDGNGHTIGGMFIYDDISNCGLFNTIGQNGTVKNLGIVNSFIKADKYIGGIAGNSEGLIENCYNEGRYFGANSTGGIVGANYGQITGCQNFGQVYDYEFSGGIAGNNSGTVENCTNTGKITAGSCAGGIAGIVMNNNGKVEACFNYGEISLADCAGGVAGVVFNGASVVNCYNIGDITDSHVSGGLAGLIIDGRPCKVINSYNIGKVNGSSESGGIIGEMPGEGEVINCFYLASDENYTNDYGTELSAEEFSNESVFSGADFDFDAVWNIDTTLGRPILKDFPEKDIEISLVSCVKTEEGYDIFITFTQTAPDSTVIAALYDSEGRLLSTEFSEASGLRQCTLNSSAKDMPYRIKVYLWKGLSHPKPLCEQYELET